MKLKVKKVLKKKKENNNCGASFLEFLRLSKLKYLIVTTLKSIHIIMEN
jgi:hypothetical protein